MVDMETVAAVVLGPLAPDGWLNNPQNLTWQNRVAVLAGVAFGVAGLSIAPIAFPGGDLGAVLSLVAMGHLAFQGVISAENLAAILLGTCLGGFATSMAYRRPEEPTAGSPSSPEEPHKTQQDLGSFLREIPPTTSSERKLDERELLTEVRSFTS